MSRGEDHAQSSALMRWLSDISGLLDVTKMCAMAPLLFTVRMARHSGDRRRRGGGAGTNSRSDAHRNTRWHPGFVRKAGVQIGRSLEQQKAGRPPKDALDKVEAAYFWQTEWKMSARPRISQKTYSDSTPPVTYSYDTAGVAYAIGRLTQMASNGT